MIEMEDIIIWGETSVLPADSGSYCIDSYGIWLPGASSGSKKVPESMLSSLPYHKLMSEASWMTEAFATNVTFKNWASGEKSCSSSKYHRIFAINSAASDHVPVIVFTNSVFENVANDAIAYLYDPPAGWADINDCGAFPCTAPKNLIIKFVNSSASGANIPDIDSIQTGGVDFVILPDNYDAVSYLDNCTRVSAWNGYKCYNNKIGQIMFESLDSDKYDRTVSPINIVENSTGSLGFNNTLNSFMDHCRGGDYTCQKRLSRFPSLVQLDKKYEIYYTGTPPGDTRYRIQGATSTSEYLHVLIDFSQSRLYDVYANDVKIAPNDFNTTSLSNIPLQYTSCGENVYDGLSYIYEFYITYGCTVRLDALDYLKLRVRLDISYNDFYVTGSRTSLVDRMASALGIIQDRIKIVHTEPGSTIVEYGISTNGTDEADTLGNYVVTLNQAGNLNLGFTILELSLTAVLSTGEVVSTSNVYKKKDISTAVYIMVGVSSVVVVIGVTIFVLKAYKMAKTYKKVVNADENDYETGKFYILD